MENPLLPCLNHLRTTLGTLSSVLQSDPELGMPSAIAARLLDRVHVDQTLVPTLRARSYARMAALLPEFGSVADARVLQELRDLCAAADPAAFTRFRQLLGVLQRGLLSHGADDSTSLARDLWRIETDYCLALESAVDARAAEQARRTADSNALGARYSRDIDEAALLEFLRNAFPHETTLGIRETSFVSGGYSKFTASITLDRARTLPAQVILRGDGNDTFGGSSVREEYHLLKIVHDHGVCVPRPLALEPGGKVFGSPFLLVEKRPGRPMGNMFFLPQQPDRARARDIAAKLASIHRVPLAALASVDGATAPASARTRQWIDGGQRSWLALDMPSPVFEIAFDWLRRNAHVNDRGPRTLVHGDFALHNLLFEGDQVTAILDWEFAHVGCPAYDLGYFHYMATALCDWEEFLDAYAASGMPQPDEEQVNYNILLAATRLGVMVCQSTALFTSGAEAGALAVNLSSCLYEVTIRRMSETLDKLL